MRRAQLIVVSLTLLASAASWRATCEWSRRATLPSPGVALLRACATAAEEGPSAAVSSPSASTAAPHVERELGDHHAESMRLLDSLDAWLRRQTVASVLPRSEAQALLDDLRGDRRFWAQQRRQYSRVWMQVEHALQQEARPLREVLGAETSARLLDALANMDENPELVTAVLRSEAVELLLGHVLYEGIVEFIQQVDVLGNVVNSLPVIGPIRVQIMTAARDQLDLLVGKQIASFLGEYTATAATSAAGFVLNEENKDVFRMARRKVGSKVLDTPVSGLVEIVGGELEMALLRDSVWSAVQEFRLPNEDSLLDALYGEFGEEPCTILLPSRSSASRGDAPLFERGRGVLGNIVGGFLASDDWGRWRDGRALAEEEEAAAEEAPPPDAATSDEPASLPKSLGECAERDRNVNASDRGSFPMWDGWD